MDEILCKVCGFDIDHLTARLYGGCCEACAPARGGDSYDPHMGVMSVADESYFADEGDAFGW